MTISTSLNSMLDMDIRPDDHEAMISMFRKSFIGQRQTFIETNTLSLSYNPKTSMVTVKDSYGNLESVTLLLDDLFTAIRAKFGPSNAN